MKIKQLLLISAFVLMGFGAAYAQAPQQFNYQGAARNANGSPLASKQISLRISILDGSATGSAQYAETRNVTTNLLGLYNVIIGSPGATTSTGSIAAVTWQSGLKYIKVEVDVNNGTNFSVAGTAQLLSVPYALYAANSPAGAPGATGPTGPAGKGISTITNNGDGVLVFTYTDGTTFTTSSLAGPTGPQGAAGANGAQGAQGLKGDVGPQGPIGLQGLQGPIGLTGLTGPQGSAGPSTPQTITHTLSSAGNMLTSDVNGIAPTANIINTNVLGLDATNKLTSTVNGIASNKVDLASLATTADNGLTKTANNIQLGGALLQPSTITTDATNTLTIAGLQTGTSTDRLVVADATGVLKSVPSNNLAQDLRLVGTDNHISQDAGVGSNGTSVGTGADNTAIGKNALNANTTGSKNIAIGTDALSLNSVGYNNLALGYFAAQKNTTGFDNVALGAYALNNNTTGTQNVAIGALPVFVSGVANVAVGINSAENQTTGNQNTFVGNNSAPDLISGNFNTMIGSKAGALQKGGQYNIAIGASAALLDPIGSNQLNLANNIFGTGLTGTITAPAGNIGIGEVAPSSTLSIGGSMSLPIRVIAGPGFPEAIATLGPKDHTLVLDYPNLDYTDPDVVYLPDATTCIGRVYNIKVYNSYSNRVSVKVTGGLTQIKASDSSMTTFMNIGGRSIVTFHSTGLYWVLLQY